VSKECDVMKVSANRTANSSTSGEKNIFTKRQDQERARKVTSGINFMFSPCILLKSVTFIGRPMHLIV